MGDVYTFDQARTQLEVQPESLTIADMLPRFVQIATGPVIVDMRNPARRLRPLEFAAAYAHCKHFVDKTAIPITKIWSQSPQRMTAERIAFNPAEGRFFMEEGLRHFNLWSPPSWPRVDSAAARPFFEHLDYLIPAPLARADFLDWFAHIVLQPAVRPHFHFLLVAFKEGTGRSWMADLMRRVLGERHAASTDLHRLLDDPFNSILSSKLLIAVHEVKAPADERYSHRDRLKSLLTDTYVTINEKNLPRWVERFCARFLMFTNRDDALPLSETDRRVYVVRCAETPKPESYYRNLYALLEDTNFLAAVWHTLRSRDIRAFNPGRRAPLNDMKVQMIAAGRSDEQQTAVDFASACPHPVVPADDLMQVLVPRLDEHERASERHKRALAVSAVLKDIGIQTYPRKVRVRVNQYGLTTRVSRLWLLAEADRCLKASLLDLQTEAYKARSDFLERHHDGEALVEVWEAKQTPGKAP